jgi:hypothetical protein
VSLQNTGYSLTHSEKGREEQKKAEVKAKQQQSFASFFKAKKEVPSPKPSPVAGPSSVREKSAEASCK